MDRRDFLRTTGSAAAAGAAVGAIVPVAARAGSVPGSDAAAAMAAPAVLSGTQTLHLAVPVPDNGRGLAENARCLGRSIEALTGGRTRIVVLAADAGSANADMWAGSVHDHGTGTAAFAFFGGLPGRNGLSATDLDAWLAIGGGQSLWDHLAAAHGFKSFLAGHTGAAPALWSRRPIASPNAFSGLTYAGEGLAGDVARGLGAQPVAVCSASLAHALRDGVADVVEGGGAVASLALGLAGVAKFALDSGINRNGVAQSLSIKLAAWERISQTDQMAIAAACAQEFRLSSAESRLHEGLAWRVMCSRHGVTLARPDNELVEAIDGVSDAIVAFAAGSSSEARRINASYMAFKGMLPVPTPTFAAGV